MPAKKKTQKYWKNIVTEDLMPPRPTEYIKMMEDQEKEGKILDRTMMMGIQDSIVKGAFFAGCEWLWGLPGGKPVQIELEHLHDFDEIIGFVGSKRNNPRDLGGEIELWIEDEPYNLTKSCYIFLPAGTKHCPLIIKKIDTPIFMFESGNNTAYKLDIQSAGGKNAKKTGPQNREKNRSKKQEAGSK